MYQDVVDVNQNYLSLLPKGCPRPTFLVEIDWFFRASIQSDGSKIQSTLNVKIQSTIIFVQRKKYDSVKIRGHPRDYNTLILPFMQKEKRWRPLNCLHREIWRGFLETTEIENASIWLAASIATGVVTTPEALVLVLVAKNGAGRGVISAERECINLLLSEEP